MNLSYWRWRLRHVHWKRLYFGLQTRTAPWRVPPGVAVISLRRPPERVFEFFRHLHGLEEPPLTDDDYRRAAADMPEKAAQPEEER